MTEFELHQLIIQSRWEFDRASIMILLLSAVVCVLSRLRSDGLSTKLRWGLSALTLVGGLYFFLRGWAAMRRFFYQSQILDSLDPVYWHGFAPLQLPTLFARLSFLIICLGIALLFVHSSKRA